MSFTEVWNIDSASLENPLFNIPLIVGIVFIVYESIVVISRKRWGEESRIFQILNMLSKPPYPWSLIFFPIGAVAIGIGAYLYFSRQNEIDELAEMSNSSAVEIVEGTVEVEFEQPKSGHTGGDIIHVGDKTFEISYFYQGYAYKETIAQGGVLTDGALVRIHYLPTKNSEKDQYEDGKIVKIEIGK